MRFKRVGATLCLVAMLAGCGGGGGSSGSSAVATTTPTVTPTAIPSPTASVSCSLRSRQDWVRAQLGEWYLFPETLPVSLDPASYTSVDSYLDALTATARAQRRDRFFTYLTSIASENAFYASDRAPGSASGSRRTRPRGESS